jgi:hypothetical protein
MSDRPARAYVICDVSNSPEIDVLAVAFSSEVAANYRDEEEQDGENYWIINVPMIYPQQPTNGETTP